MPTPDELDAMGLHDLADEERTEANRRDNDVRRHSLQDYQEWQREQAAKKERYKLKQQTKSK